MVGRISGVSRAPESSKRWIINIDSYSEVDIPNQWDGNRNPVSYRSLEDIGIDVSKLEFKPVSKIIPTDFIATNKGNEYEGEYNEDMVNPLTIKDAKAGLALYFGVNQEDIQITIKG
ncbi:hypothetical protein ABRP91_13840 [Pectobacterium brasiliense]|uniref:hypothetical protein n=1 Tax=Pectobacterium brasiliense TaxID=180957 RepID=UPI0032F05849